MHGMPYHHLSPVARRNRHLSPGAAAGPGLVPLNSTALPLDQNYLKSCLHLACPSQPPAGSLGPFCRLLACPEFSGRAWRKLWGEEPPPARSPPWSSCFSLLRCCWGCVTVWPLDVAWEDWCWGATLCPYQGFALLWARSSLVLWTECPPGTAMPELHSWRALWVLPERDPGYLLCAACLQRAGHRGRAGAFFCSLWDESESWF